MLKYCLSIWLLAYVVTGIPSPAKTDNNEGCFTTTESAVSETECVFPFIHDNVKYDGCPVDPIDKTKRWCSTKTNQKGIHINGNWGYCSSSCKQAEENLNEENVCLTTAESVVSETKCVFPFIHDDVAYYGCVIDPIDETKRWCSTKTEENGLHINGNWGYCPPSCKKAEENLDKDDEDYDGEEEADVCLTSLDSKDPEKECVFPFTYNNFTYNGCPTDPEDETKRWCSTKTNKKGVHVTGSNSWGYCTTGCYPEIFPGKFLL